MSFEAVSQGSSRSKRSHFIPRNHLKTVLTVHDWGSSLASITPKINSSHQHQKRSERRKSSRKPRVMIDETNLSSKMPGKTCYQTEVAADKHANNKEFCIDDENRPSNKPEGTSPINRPIKNTFFCFI